MQTYLKTITPRDIILCDTMGLASKLRDEIAAAETLPPPAPISSDTSSLVSKIQAVLNKAVKDRGLVFYDAPKIEALAQTLATTVNYADLVRRTNKKITEAMAIDLSAMALYDIVFLGDNSGSMQYFAGRIDDLRSILSETAQVATLFDSDGVSVCFLNHDKTFENIKTEADVMATLKDVSFAGMTPLGTEFKRKVIDKYVSKSEKPVLAFIITDGEPQGEDRNKLVNVIRQAKADYGPGRLAVQIAQVGTDKLAQEFLKTLDDDTTVGDMIDCTSNYEMEAEEWNAKAHGIELTVFLFFMKLWLGGINSEYDSLG